MLSLLYKDLELPFVWCYVHCEFMGNYEELQRLLKKITSSQSLLHGVDLTLGLEVGFVFCSVQILMRSESIGSNECRVQVHV